MPLTNVLKQLRASATSHADILEVQRKALRNHGDEIERKADIKVEDAVEDHTAHLERIQAKLDADADVDMDGSSSSSSSSSSAVGGAAAAASTSSAGGSVPAINPA